MSKENKNITSQTREEANLSINFDIELKKKEISQTDIKEFISGSHSSLIGFLNEKYFNKDSKNTIIVPEINFDLLNLDLSNKNLSGCIIGSKENPVTIMNCNLTNSSLRDNDLNVRFAGSNLTNLDLRGADLVNSEFIEYKPKDKNLSGIKFSNTADYIKKNADIKSKDLRAKEINNLRKSASQDIKIFGRDFEKIQNSKNKIEKELKNTLNLG